MFSRLFLQQKKKASLPHAMLSLQFPDPLPFSVHPQEVSLRTRLCSVAQIAEAGASGMATSPNTAVRLPSADPGGVTPSAFACILQVPAWKFLQVNS